MTKSQADQQPEPLISHSAYFRSPENILQRKGGSKSSFFSIWVDDSIDFCEHRVVNLILKVRKLSVIDWIFLFSAEACQRSKLSWFD